MACLPIIVLLLLLIKFQWGATEAAPIGLLITIITAVAFYKADFTLLASETAKGIWSALPILLIVWTAILLYQVADEAKAFLVIRNGMRKLLPNELFMLYIQLHPNLLKTPPVQNVENVGKCFDDFMIVLSHLCEATDDSFFSILPVIDRYLRHVLSPFAIEGKASKLREAKAVLEADFRSTLEEIAGSHMMSYSTFRKAFAENYGISPQQYRLRCRIEKAHTASLISSS